MKKPPVRVIVERHSGKLYMTVFSVGVQFFKLAEAEEGHVPPDEVICSYGVDVSTA